MLMYKQMPPLVVVFMVVLAGFVLSPQCALGQTYYEWDFEDPNDPWGAWYPDNGVWEVGEPTSGPGSAHSPVNCAGTVLGGLYPRYTESRLISPPIALPVVAGGERLQLRFWHWFSYAGYDSGRVAVSVWDDVSMTWGAWLPLGPTIYNISSVWSPRYEDLTSHAGKTVRISFQHTENDDTSQSTGWYIDDVQVVKILEKVLPFTGDFEAGWEDWFAENGVWEVGEPTSGPGSAYSPVNCAGTVLGGPYPRYTESRLISPPIVLPAVAGGEQLQLRFWHWFSCSGYDSGRVAVSVWDDVSMTWGAWLPLGPTIYNISSVWSPRYEDLTSHAGKTVRISFQHTENDDTSQSTGWYIDDVQVVKKVLGFTGDFEAGWEDWYAENGVWEVGEPTSGPDSAHSGVNCVGTVLRGLYPRYTESRLISPPIVLPAVAGGEQLRLRFYHWFSYSGGDSGRVAVSVWDDVSMTWGAWLPLGEIISNISSVWSPRYEDLTAHAGKTVRISFQHTENDDTSQSTGWYIDDIEFPGFSPVIDSVDFDEYIPAPETTQVIATAHDPRGGNLSYIWDGLDGGLIIGDGAQIEFAPPLEARFCPYRVRVAACSDVTHLCSTKIIRIYTRLPGDADGNKVCNIVDKVLVRNQFGLKCGDAGWDPRADVNCDCVVNIVDKTIVRNYFGQQAP